MFKKISRNAVDGYLKADGRRIVNGKGEEFLPLGVAFGNWLLCEGNMWAFGEGNYYDRPRRFEALIRELCGSKYASTFWHRFHNNFVTEADIEAIADYGFNSVRIPINWRIILEDEPGIHFIEEGFELIDRCIDWCEKNRLYVFLDLHGAVGGQTGTHIDDSINNIPRLFIDEDCYTKTLAIWQELARRYRDRWIVGGYDLINEPLSGEHKKYTDRLRKFYEDCVKAIREIDKRHVIILEGTDGASNPAVFTKRFDDNSVMSLHMYCMMPCEETFEPWLELSERFDLPLWLGETGRSRPEWFTASYTMALQLGIGVNFWPWKRTAWKVGALSNPAPEGWEDIVAYTRGGKHPGYERSQKILDDFLKNMLYENCDRHDNIVNAVLRRPDVRIPAIAFDVDSRGKFDFKNGYGFRNGSGYKIELKEGRNLERLPSMDICEVAWDALTLVLSEGERADYTVTCVPEGCPLFIEADSESDSTVSVYQNGTLLSVLDLKGGESARVEAGRLSRADELKITLEATRGSLKLNALSVGDIKESHCDGFLEIELPQL
jgi:hypothetical protein